MNIKELVLSHHDENLRKEHNVVQVWSDGRITYTKGGELLGHRSLFDRAKPIPGMELFTWYTEFPIARGEAPGYAFVTEEHAWEIRAAMIDALCGYLQSCKQLRF